jgi:hypothetical protein
VLKKRPPAGWADFQTLDQEQTIWVNSADRARLGDSIVVVPQEDFPETLVNAFWGTVVAVGEGKTYRVQLASRYTARPQLGTTEYAADCMAGYPHLAAEGKAVARQAWPDLAPQIASLPRQERAKYVSEAAIPLADRRIGQGISSGPVTHQDRCIAVRYGVLMELLQRTAGLP